MTEDKRTADEQALVALFASLVDDSPPSEVSPLQVLKLAKDEKRAQLDQRIKRVKFGRNVLLAAALAAVVALVFPHLGRSSSDTASSGSSSSAAAAPAQAAVPGEGAVSSEGSQTSAPAADSSAAGGFAAGSSAAASGEVQVPARAGSAAAGSSTSGSPAASAAAAPSGPRPDASSTGTARCVALPAKAVAAATAALPPGYALAAVPTTGCELYGVSLAPAQKSIDKLTILVSRAAAGSCQATGVPFACSPVPGESGVYQSTSTSGAKQITVYRDGYEVTLGPVGSLTTDQVIAVSLAVVKALG